MTDEILAEIALFTQEDWDIFIQRLCYQEKVEPSLDYVADNLSQQIFWLHDWFLEKDRSKINNLVEAVVRTLKSILPVDSNAEAINVLIYFIAEIKPITQRKSVLSLVKVGRFSNLYYGSDNLYLMLLLAYIPLENGALEAEEYYLGLNFRGEGYYHLYLQVAYYCALDLDQQALRLISKVLNASFGDDEEYNFNMENILTDFVPSPVSFLQLVKYLIENNVIIKKQWQFKNSLGRAVTYWKENYSDELQGLLLFLEDILLSSENNARETPAFLEDLSRNSKLVRQLIKSYYGETKVKHDVKSIEDYIKYATAAFN